MGPHTVHDLMPSAHVLQLLVLLLILLLIMLWSPDQLRVPTVSWPLPRCCQYRLFAECFPRRWQREHAPQMPVPAVQHSGGSMQNLCRAPTSPPA